MKPKEEYHKIVDIMARYAVHYPMLKFTCKSVEDKKTDVTTMAVQRPDISSVKDEAEFLSKLNLVRIDVIKRQYGYQNTGKDLYQALH